MNLRGRALRLTLRAAAVVCLPVGVVASGCWDDVDDFGFTGAVFGVTCDSVTGRPLATTIDLVSVEPGEPRSFTGASDDRGIFLVEGVSPGRYQVRPRGRAAIGVVEVSLFETADIVDPACIDRPPVGGFGTIAGHFCDVAEATPLTDADLRITAADGRVIEATTLPGTGAFALDVPSGLLTVEVRGPNTHKSLLVEVAVDDDVVIGDGDCVAIRDDATFGVGRICHPGTDEPAERVAVEARWTGADGVVHRSDRFFTLADGTFRTDALGPLPLQSLELQARSADQLVAWTVDVTAPDGEGSLDLHPGVPCMRLQADERAPLLVQGENDRPLLSPTGPVTIVDASAGPWVADTFSDLERLRDSPTIVVTCGVHEDELDEPVGATAAALLRQYVADGGTLVVTDWSYDVVERSFPEHVNFVGDDGLLDAAQIGLGGGIVAAAVVNDDLAAEVGRVVDVDLGGAPLLALISEVSPDVEVLLHSDMPYRVDGAGAVLSGAPLAVRFRHGFGTVTYTSFHLDGAVSAALLRHIVAIPSP